MTLENLSYPAGVVPKSTVERYGEYPSHVHDQTMYYPYDHPYDQSPPSQGHVVSLPSKHHFAGWNHKNNAAMSALTLLAFLFFLHILQQCLKEHMTALNTPQVMIMTGGKEGEENIARISNKKVDKTGVSQNAENQKNKINPGHVPESSSDDNDKYFMKITSSEYAPWKKFQNSRNIFKPDIEPVLTDFVKTMDEY